MPSLAKWYLWEIPRHKEWARRKLEWNRERVKVREGKRVHDEALSWQIWPGMSIFSPEQTPRL
jgi:hypothetical protein